MKHNQIKSKADRVILERKHKRERKPKVCNYSPRSSPKNLEPLLTCSSTKKSQITAFLIPHYVL